MSGLIQFTLFRNLISSVWSSDRHLLFLHPIYSYITHGGGCVQYGSLNSELHIECLLVAVKRCSLLPKYHLRAYSEAVDH